MVMMEGARILVLGFFVAFFAQLRELAANAAGPLFARDVERVDRQDDRAAARTFSATALDFHLKTYPDQRGLSVYLFVLGDLVDAWQNRNISHQVRAKMVIRARFFLMAWRTHILAHPDYTLHTQFISRESFDIFMTVTDSLLSLIIIYRKYYSRYPLLPWLHSTEPCEHVFGALRQIKKDFTFADMLSAQPKLQALLLGAFGDLTPEEQSNQTASGYHHTYFKADDLDLKELSQYPTDDDLVSASDAAFKEAEELLASLGINAGEMLKSYVEPLATTQKKKTKTSNDTSSGPQTLAQVLALYCAPKNLSKEENAVEATEMALVADSIDRSLAFEDLPNSSDATFSEVKASIDSVCGPQKILTTAAPNPSKAISLKLVPLSLLTAEKNLNREIMVAERRRHGTQFTAKAVRQNGKMALTFNDRTFNRFVNKGATLREALILHLSTLAAPSMESSPLSKPSTSGINRQVRHTGTFVEASDNVNGESVQSKNKATVKVVAASRFLHLREQAFEAMRDLHENFRLANVTSYNTLNPGNLVIVLRAGKKKEVILGEVITMYSKGSGKNARHEWLPSTDNIGILSNIYVRVFTPFAGENMFTSMSCPSLASSSIIQIPRSHILFSLASSSKDILWQPMKTSEGHPFSILTICAYSTSIFRQFRQRQAALYAGVEILKKTMKAKDQVGVVAGQDLEIDDHSEDSEASGMEDE